MSLHPKSLIHEYIAKNPDQNIIIDIVYDHKFYRHNNLSGDNNVNIFICIMTVTFKNNEQLIIKSPQTYNKKDAERNAYMQLLNIINKTCVDNNNNANDIIINIDNDNGNDNEHDTNDNDIQYNNINILIIVDYENISKYDILKLENYVVRLSNILNNNNKTIKIIKIAGYCSSNKKNANIIVRSNRKDAVDHFISYYIGKIESNLIEQQIYIMTHDKFGSCLQDFCNNVIHVADADDFIVTFNKNNNFIESIEFIDSLV